MDTNTHKHTQTHTNTHNTHKHIQTHTTHTNTYKHTQTHTNTHKHTQTYAQTLAWLCASHPLIHIGWLSASLCCRTWLPTAKPNIGILTRKAPAMRQELALSARGAYKCLCVCVSVCLCV